MDSIRAADIAVLTAGEHTRPGQTRLDMLDHNLAVATEVADALEQALPRVVIVVSSPLDVLTEYLTRRWESRPVQVFGTGTSLDSWRLRELLAVELGVHPGNVHAWVIGEHGDSAVFPFEMRPGRAVLAGRLRPAVRAAAGGRAAGRDRAASARRGLRGSIAEGLDDERDRPRDRATDSACGARRAQARAGQRPCRRGRLREPARPDRRGRGRSAVDARAERSGATRLGGELGGAARGEPTDPDLIVPIATGDARSAAPLSERPA